MNRHAFDEALQTFLRETAGQKHCEGVLVSGSYANGELGPYSDIDLYVLLADHAGDLAGWETRDIAAIECEITRNTADGYRAVLRAGKDVRGTIVPLAEGRILIDRNGRLAEIRHEAQDAVRALSARVSPDREAKQSIVRPLAFGFRKIGNAYIRQDWYGFDYEYGFVLHLLAVQVLALSGRRVAPRPLQALREALPEIHQLLAACLNSQTHDEKWASFRNLIQRVFFEFSLGELPQPVP